MASQKYYISILFALVAVVLWSLHATVAVYGRGRANYAAMVFGGFLCAVVFFGVWYWQNRSKWTQEYQSVIKDESVSTPYFITLLISFGICLALYDLMLIYSLQEGPSIPANMINYLWPMLFPLLGAVVFRREESNLGFYEISVLSIAFGGAILIAGGTEIFSHADFQFSLLFAFLAAVSAGIYLNLLSIIQRWISSTASVYFIGSVISVPVIGLFLIIYRPEIHITIEGVPIILAYGFMTFGLARYMYGEAIRYGEDVIISALAYLTPVLSTVFLAVLAQEPLSQTVAFGAVLIIAAQVLLNENFKHISSITGGLITVFLVSIYIYTDPQIIEGLSILNRYGDVIVTIFAVFAGFILSRVWSINSNVHEKVTDINIIIKELASEFENSNEISDEKANKCEKELDQLLITIVDLSYDQKVVGDIRKMNYIYNQFDICEKELNSVSDGVSAENKIKKRVCDLREDIEDWLMITQDTVRNGEMAVLSLLGISTIFIFIAGSGDNFLEHLLTISLSGAITFTILKIRDYNYNRVGQHTKLLAEQSAVIKLGYPPYLPQRTAFLSSSIVDSMESNEIRIKKEGYYDTIESDDGIKTVSGDDFIIQSYVRYGLYMFISGCLLTIIVLIYFQTPSF